MGYPEPNERTVDYLMHVDPISIEVPMTMRSLSVFLTIFIATTFAVASPKLLPWDDASCFRNSINFCDDDQIYVRDQRRPARCGCLRPDEFIPLDLCRFGAPITCNKNALEEFSLLHK